MTGFIDDYQSTVKEYINMTNLEKSSNIVNWFLKDIDKHWEAYFLKWLNKSKGLALLYFKEIELDIVARLDNNLNFEFGSKILLTCNGADKKDNLLDFLVC